ncbi:hypothetical protein S58_67330 [Bradyrhizobium oligotrophicum S58]|uniref:Uncharacterized protein n=1 Tax=Bradyrhizobium oligotrophicum S58 TaxID=1245469 RepID=M5A1I7_9BRAD|nr:hypothetical protein [Bradyrhizobium oligotrophicum]BAM92700.1 hypothetical protein S58_67330 [Bradyrhizobium oligotrophicum S58]
MRLVLVHGINQEGKSEQIIKEEWLGALEQALGRPGRFDRASVRAPFYGDDLARLTDGGTLGQAIAQGVAEDDEERAFITAGLQQMALDAGLTDDQISTQQTVEQGFPHDRRFIAIVRLLEGLSPFHGEIALRVLKQAYTYLKQPHATAAVDAIVEPVLREGPCVVVAHSLGTVVTFKLLRKLAAETSPVHVPLFLTIGSPLAIVAVQTALKKPRAVPGGVARWFNGLDPNDFVTLGRALTAETFAAGIDNRTDIDNGDDPHASQRYLKDSAVSAAVDAAV